MNMANDIYVVGDNEELTTSIQEQIKDTFQLHFVTTTELKKYNAQIILIINSENNSAVEDAQLVLTDFPTASIICVNDEENFEVLRGLIRLGVSDYYVFPGEEILFMEKLISVAKEAASLYDRETDSGSFKKGGGKVFAFYSGSGGVGKSLISTAFAQTIKLESTANVLYIDLNLQYGGSETFLGLESSRSIVDLIPVIDEMSEHHIRNVAEVEKHSNLQVLLSPSDAEMAEKISDEFILRLLRASKRNYDFIIIDLPAWVDERIYAALEEADKIYYVMNIDTIAIRVLKNVESLFHRLGITTEDRLELVMNFKGKDKELNKKDMERFIAYTIAAEIRRDKGLQQYINQGEPLRKEAKEKKLTAVAKDVHKWVHSMLK
ncbi:AAA family ATPase [Virgibacillus sp. NKC19-16]|uniref:AAA family ATPase n=1 Tax=Virgibacillus salidurans TaxID=2831673 RepID=UPI001F20AB58|nr:AAA family ATPase [Virgibacillus sp. NKC19-16]UJL47021.1 AAA family ATPase [Virgibacillus sp. NKC19-16]